MHDDAARRAARRAAGCRAGGPPRLTDLAAQISAALGGRPVNPDSPAQLMRALAADGVRVPSTRFAVLRDVDHPAMPLLLEYKELPGCTRRTAGPGWTSGCRAAGSARSTWSAGWCPAAGPPGAAARCRSRGCCAGRWWPIPAGCWWSPTPRSSSRGCWPRWPATARSPRRPATGDLYEALAGAFGGDRDKAKIALLSAMYGGAGGEAGQLLAVLRRRFPLRRAVRGGGGPGGRGRPGGQVPAGPDLPAAVGRVARADRGAGRPGRRRTRGRAARCGPAAGSPATSSCRRARPTGRWCCWPACAAGWRRWHALAGPAAGRSRRAARLVFFQHDEVIVHCPEAMAGDGGGGRLGGAEAGPAAVRRDPGPVPDDDRGGRLLRGREVDRRTAAAGRGGGSAAAAVQACVAVQYLQRLAATGMVLRHSGHACSAASCAADAVILGGEDDEVVDDGRDDQEVQDDVDELAVEELAVVDGEDRLEKFGFPPMAAISGVIRSLISACTTARRPRR